MRRVLLEIGAVCAAALLAFAGGRWTAPERVRVEEKVRVEYRDREVVRTVEGPVRWREKRVEVPGPAGPTVTVEKWTEKDPVVVERVVTREGETRTLRVETPTVESWRVAVSAGWTGLRLDPGAWSLSVDRRVAGPVWLGAYARTDALALKLPTEAGITVGVTW